MTVKEAVNMLQGTNYEIKGAYSGKIYFKSRFNRSKILDKYADREVIEAPFYADMRIYGSDTNKWCEAIVVIWMHDYDLCKMKGEQI